MSNLWQRWRRSAGFGIHSPHAYRFVTEVIGERSHYYAYDDIAALRHTVIAAAGSHWPHRRVLSNHTARLLLRVTNHFNPQYILQVGTTHGISAAVMLAVSSSSRLWLYEPQLAQRPVARQVLGSLGGRVVSNAPDLAETIIAYEAALIDNKAKPFVLVNNLATRSDWGLSCDIFGGDYLEWGSVVILRNLASDRHVAQLWDELRSCLKHGQTFTDGRLAIIIANPKLQPEHFELWL